METKLGQAPTWPEQVRRPDVSTSLVSRHPCLHMWSGGPSKQESARFCGNTERGDWREQIRYKRLRSQNVKCKLHSISSEKLLDIFPKYPEM